MVKVQKGVNVDCYLQPTGCINWLFGHQVEMTDILTKQQRSKLMSKVHGRDTKPEWVIRSALHRLGFRYTLRNHKLPGKPDIVLKKYKTVIFIHGCFWHSHKDCPKSSIPKSNTEFWRNKLNSNLERDNKNIKLLKDSGWRVLVLWECEIYSETLETISKVVDSLIEINRSIDVDMTTLNQKDLIKNAENKFRKKFSESSREEVLPK